jgi:hypothetical protein
MLIGLTGRRGVGKSEIAKALEERHGFVKLHAFAGGKAATEAYFRHIGAEEDVAFRMVHGDLRDIRSDLLPGGQTPRFFMERFGFFMGHDLGPTWTLGMEIARFQRLHPGKSAIIESVVYEAGVLRAAGGVIVRVERPGHEGVVGIKTDAVQAGIVADETILNDGSIDDLNSVVDRLVERLRAQEVVFG